MYNDICENTVKLSTRVQSLVWSSRPRKKPDEIDKEKNTTQGRRAGSYFKEEENVREGLHPKLDRGGVYCQCCQANDSHHV